MKSILIMGAVLTVLILIMIVFVIAPNLKKASAAIDKIEDKIGTTVVYNKDTVMLVDYSILNETYTLSNGMDVSFKLIDKLDSIQ